MAAGALPAATPSRDCWAIHVSDRFDESRMLVTEKVFGFPIGAIAAQLIFDGLASAELIAPVKQLIQRRIWAQEDQSSRCFWQVRS